MKKQPSTLKDLPIKIPISKNRQQTKFLDTTIKKSTLGTKNDKENYINNRVDFSII